MFNKDILNTYENRKKNIMTIVVSQLCSLFLQQAFVADVKSCLARRNILFALNASFYFGISVMSFSFANICRTGLICAAIFQFLCLPLACFVLKFLYLKTKIQQARMQV